MTSMTDATHRFVFENTDIRGNLATLSGSYRAIVSNQSLPVSLQPLLGEFVAAVALLSETLKYDGILTLQVRGNGPVPLIVADCTNDGDLRGIIELGEHQPLPDYSGLTLPELIGDGVLSLTVDPEHGQRYQGLVPLEGDTLADCLALYFAQSEQLPTKLWLFADQNHCGGLMLQGLPAQQVTDLDQRKEQWQTAVQLANTVTPDELFSLPANDLLYRLFNELGCRLFAAREFRFHCSCNRARGENAISSLGKEEAFALLAEQNGKIAVDCHFCGQHYAFKEEDLQRLFSGSMH